MNTITFPRTSAIRTVVLFWILLIAGYLLLAFNMEGCTYDPDRAVWKHFVEAGVCTIFILLVATLRANRDLKALFAAEKEKEDLTSLRIARGHYIFSLNVFLGALALTLGVSLSGLFLPLPLTPLMAFMCLVVFMSALYITDSLLISAFSTYSIAMREREKKPEAQESETEKGGQP